MKTLILYATHKGCTRKCAGLLREQMGEGEVLDVKKARAANLGEYDAIVLGTSIWAEKIHSAMRRFVEKNLPVLLSKRVGLFICSGEEKPEYFSGGFPADLVTHAAAREFFGGEMNINDFNFLMRWMLKKAAGVTESYSRLKPEAIRKLAAALKA